jgi:stress response protein SCP2
MEKDMNKNMNKGRLATLSLALVAVAVLPLGLAAPVVHVGNATTHREFGASVTPKSSRSAVELVLRNQDGAAAARATLDAATAEQTLVLATLYRRGDAWRFRAVGHGYELGPAAIAVRHGVDIDED